MLLWLTSHMCRVPKAITCRNTRRKQSMIISEYMCSYLPVSTHIGLKYTIKISMMSLHKTQTWESWVTDFFLTHLFACHSCASLILFNVHRSLSSVLVLTFGYWPRWNCKKVGVTPIVPNHLLLRTEVLPSPCIVYSQLSVSIRPLVITKYLSTF